MRLCVTNNVMRYIEVLKIAAATLRKNRARTILTVLGVMIGISSVTVIISTGNSIEKLVYDQMASFGSDFIQTEVRVPKSSGGVMSQAQGVVITTMKDSDRKEILKLPNISQAYSAITAQELLSWQSEIKKTFIYGVTADFINIDSSEIEEGRFFTDEEDNSLARVVVLGQEVKNDLFGSSPAVGQNVKIKNTNYKVIGVMKPRGTVFFFNMDEIAYIPLQTTQKLILGVDYIASVTAQAIDADRIDETSETIRKLIRERHDITDPDKDDFEVSSIADAQEMMSTVIGGVTLLLIALAAVSLIVGGVGIMNIMYATVAERTFEIGLRKSVGAPKHTIMQQFLTEAILITFLGGIFGIVFGLVLIYVIYLLANYYNLDWSLTISPMGIFLALSFSIAVGLIFGLYPAKRAADLDPIAALRKE